ncbi:tRNA threonylcarbamoyladenosine dehydratase [archaeon]|nr:MAG: tRNA threonylcarbamoyladenosine dehydratase [archaeon]
MASRQTQSVLLAGAATASLALAAYATFTVSAKSASPLLQTSSKQREDCPEEIKQELLARICSFFGEDGLNRLRSSFVIVVGLGGVGSHCAHMLARSGVGKLRLIDFDQVTLSSLNRHAVATLADVGISKAEAMRRRLKEVVPWCDIDGRAAMFKMDQAADLLAGQPDFVIDCIDDVNTKAELIAYCKQHNIAVLTSMGAGGKADPTRLRIAPLSDCINDPLCQKIKWKLKKYNVLPDDVLSVFSIEKPICNLLPLDEEQRANPQDFGTVDYLRLRIMPVLGTSPAIFGQALASYILCSLAGRDNGDYHFLW